MPRANLPACFQVCDPMQPQGPGLNLASRFNLSNAGVRAVL